MRAAARLLLAAVLSLLAMPAAAQTVKTFVKAYDLDATTYTYCVTSDEAIGPSQILTSGSSTTTTAASGTPFTVVAVGDELSVNLSTVRTYRTVVTHTSDTSIVVNSAWNLSGQSTSGYKWYYTHRACGTGITAGWLPASAYKNKLVKIDANAMTGTGGIDYSVECQLGGNGGATPAQLLDGNFTDTTVPTNSFTLVIPESCSGIRLGLKWHTADTAGTDSITAVLQGTTTN